VTRGAVRTPDGHVVNSDAELPVLEDRRHRIGIRGAAPCSSGVLGGMVGMNAQGSLSVQTTGDNPTVEWHHYTIFHIKSNSLRVMHFCIQMSYVDLF
jgi:hypothetical protein